MPAKTRALDMLPQLRRPLSHATRGALLRAMRYQST
jgi:hypothetical protein